MRLEGVDLFTREYFVDPASAAFNAGCGLKRVAGKLLVSGEGEEIIGIAREDWTSTPVLPYPWPVGNAVAVQLWGIGSMIANEALVVEDEVISAAGGRFRKYLAADKTAGKRAAGKVEPQKDTAPIIAGTYFLVRLYGL